MSRSTLSRWAPLFGIVFVALWVAAFAVALFEDPGEGDAEIVAYYADEGNRSRAVALFWLVVVASLVFVAFLAVLRDRLERSEGREGPLGRIAFGGGLIAAALWIAAAVFWMGVAYTANETDEFRVDPDTERLVSEMGYVFFVTGILAAISVVLGASLAARRTGLLPRWLVWVGLVIAVTMLGAFGVFPFFLFLAWILLVSIALMVRDVPADVPRSRS